MHDIQLIRTSSITDYKLSITIIVGVGELQRLKKKVGFMLREMLEI